MPHTEHDYESEFFAINEAFHNYRMSFKEFRNKPLTWNEIEIILKNSGEDFAFETGATNVKAFFGIGGRRAIKVYTARQIRHQRKILKVLSDHLELKIRFDVDDKPLIKNGNFELEENNPAITLPVSAPEENYDVFYWAGDDRLVKGRLIIRQNKQKTASLDMYYTSKMVVKLIGDHSLTGGNIVTVRIHDKTARLDNPYSQLVYVLNNVRAKQFYYAAYSTAHRGDGQYAIAGTMLLHRNDAGTSSPNPQYVEDLAIYLLNRKRFDFKIGSFDLPDETADKKGGKSRDTNIECWFEIRKYAGIYETQFVNPRINTFETGFLHIKRSGEIEMTVYANKGKGPFQGIVKMDKQKEALFIHYDYREELKDFRMTLRFDISRHNPDTREYIFGLMSGLELQTMQPMSSRMALRKTNFNEEDISKIGAKIKVFDLTNKEHFKKVETTLLKKKLHNFFFGVDLIEFDSVSFLNATKKKHR